MDNTTNNFYNDVLDILYSSKIESQEKLGKLEKILEKQKEIIKSEKSKLIFFKSRTSYKKYSKYPKKD